MSHLLVGIVDGITVVCTVLNALFTVTALTFMVVAIRERNAKASMVFAGFFVALTVLTAIGVELCKLGVN
jgi:hypothetical protein